MNHNPSQSQSQNHPGQSRRRRDPQPEAEAAPASSARSLCPQCGGRKVIAVGTDDVPCATCGATGYVGGGGAAEK
jgi:hypothetical protein